MGKKKTKHFKAAHLDEPSPKAKLDHIYGVLGRMKYRELQTACISRGMPFQKIVELDHNGLAHFFIKNFDLVENPALLNEYDIWREEQLVARGCKKGDALLHPDLRFGFVGKGDLSEFEGTKPITPKKVPEVQSDKTKREKDESTGVVSGTKKNLTYTLALEGKPVAEVINIVMEKFPEAQAKSIKIWYKRALKERDGKD